MIPGLSEFPRDGGRALSDGVVPTCHAVSSSNSSIFRVEDGSKSRDESRGRYEDISDMALSREQFGRSLVRKPKLLSCRALRRILCARLV